VNNLGNTVLFEGESRMLNILGGEVERVPRLRGV